MLLREFIQKYPDDSLDMMTPGGFVFLTPEQSGKLLAGESAMAHPGDPECSIRISAEELLSLNPHARTFGTTINETVQTVGY